MIRVHSSHNQNRKKKARKWQKEEEKGMKDKTGKKGARKWQKEEEKGMKDS